MLEGWRVAWWWLSEYGFGVGLFDWIWLLAMFANERGDGWKFLASLVAWIRKEKKGQKRDIYIVYLWELTIEHDD